MSDDARMVAAVAIADIALLLVLTALVAWSQPQGTILGETTPEVRDREAAVIEIRDTTCPACGGVAVESDGTLVCLSPSCEMQGIPARADESGGTENPRDSRG